MEKQIRSIARENDLYSLRKLHSLMKEILDKIDTTVVDIPDGASLNKLYDFFLTDLNVVYNSARFKLDKDREPNLIATALYFAPLLRSNYETEYIEILDTRLTGLKELIKLYENTERIGYTDSLNVFSYFIASNPKFIPRLFKDSIVLATVLNNINIMFPQLEPEVWEYVFKLPFYKDLIVKFNDKNSAAEYFLDYESVYYYKPFDEAFHKALITIAGDWSREGSSRSAFAILTNPEVKDINFFANWKHIKRAVDTGHTTYKELFDRSGEISREIGGKFISAHALLWSVLNPEGTYKDLEIYLKEHFTEDEIEMIDTIGEILGIYDYEGYDKKYTSVIIDFIFLNDIAPKLAHIGNIQQMPRIVYDYLLKQLAAGKMEYFTREIAKPIKGNIIKYMLAEDTTGRYSKLSGKEQRKVAQLLLQHFSLENKYDHLPQQIKEDIGAAYQNGVVPNAENKNIHFVMPAEEV